MSKAASPQGLPATLTGGAPRHRYPSDATRAERRRLRRQLPPHEVFAGRLLELAASAPDEQSRDEICQVVHNLRLRFRPDAAMRRFAVVKPPPKFKAAGGAPAGDGRSEEHRQAAAFAQQLMVLMDAAPDEKADRELNAVVKGIMLRFTPDENRQRFAVLTALESSELLSLSEIVEKTRLSEECVLAILGDFISAEVGLAFEWTPDGKRRCGRGGTTRYFGLKH